MTNELEHAIKHIKTRADAWAVKEVTEALQSISERLDKALSQEPTFDDVCQKDMNEMWEKVKTEHDPCKTCGYVEGSPFCSQYCPYDAERKKEQEPTDTWSIKDVADTFKKHGLIREQEPCDDAVSREAMQIELKKCEVIDVRDENDNLVGCYNADTVDSIVRNLPPVPQKSETVTEFADRCRECGARYGKLLKQLREQTRWIPVSERLPQKDDLYLICFDDGEYELDYFCIDTFSYSGVVAWMPLPKPYESQESEE